MELFGIIILSVLGVMGLVSVMWCAGEWLFARQLDRTILIVPVGPGDAAELLSLVSARRCGRVVAVCDVHMQSELRLSGLCDDAVTREELPELIAQFTKEL